MKRNRRIRWVMTVIAIGFMPVAQAGTKTWSGGTIGAWTVAANWSPSGVPGGSDDVVVGPGVTVTNAPGTYRTLAVQTNAVVVFSTDFISAAGQSLSVAGTIGKSNSGTLRLNGGTLNLSGHLDSSVTWLDMLNGSMSFTNGAAFDNTGMNFEHKGNNTFSFKLSPGGFKTLVAGGLKSGTTGGYAAAWSNATYNVDISDYDLRGGLRIVLIDFSGNDAVFNSGFSTAKVNIITGTSGLTANLSFDTATSQLVLTFPYPITWSGGGDGVNWLDRLNWTPTNLPTVSDDVLVGAGATVTNAQIAFKSLDVRTNASVTLSAAAGQSGLGARTVNLAGTLGVHGGSGNVVRLGGTTINLSGHLGATINFLDTYSGTINYTNGAAFDNANMGFEHKGWNTFRYTLATNGFTTMVCGRLYSGTAGFAAAWSNATYAIDVSGYTGPRPATFVLADYNGHDNIFTNTFNPTIAITGLDGGRLSFDTAASKLILKVSGPKGTLISVR